MDPCVLPRKQSDPADQYLLEECLPGSLYKKPLVSPSIWADQQHHQVPIALPLNAVAALILHGTEAGCDTRHCLGS